MKRIVTWMRMPGTHDDASTSTSAQDLPSFATGTRGSSKLNKKRNSATSNNIKNTLPNKICIGDRVKITTKKLKNCKGVVMYIGYPFPRRGMRYGINLNTANSDNDGSFMIDIKTGKLAKQSHIKKYPKRIKKRKYFKARTNHGVFVKRQDITSIIRKSTASTRITVEDAVDVRFRGFGTIKFIGTLQHTNEMGVWYGIELEERRGRHDGTVNGIKYFECAAQYGLHCRQTHLTLNKQENKENINKADTFDDAELPTHSLKKPRDSGIDKPQRSTRKIERLLGEKPPRGFPMQQAVSQMVLKGLEPQQIQKTQTGTESISMTEPQANLRLFSVSGKQRRELNKKQTLSVIIPADAFRHNISVNILPGPTKSPSKSNTEPSFKKGTTTVVLPGYYDGLKQRRFTDEFDFDEIEDQLGEGEFGVVYKCRKIEELIEDEYEYSTTLRTSRHGTQRSMPSKPSKLVDYKSITESGSGVFPVDKWSDSDNDSDNGNGNGEIYAVKKIKKAKFYHLGYKDKQAAIGLLQQEIKLLEKIQRLKKANFDGSQFVIDLMDVFEDRNYLYIVTNYCGGGNLWTYIENEDGIDHSEQSIQRIMREILEGLAFLHRNNMAHLDLKPDNIMFNSNGSIQLIDFGMSRVIPPLHKAGVLVGTPNFVAPEVIEGFYDKKADVWSIGVMFFMLRFGYPPFYIGDTAVKSDLKSEHSELFELIKDGFDPSVKPGLGAWFPSEVPVSDVVRDLITSMLDRDLASRLTASECLAHPYFKDSVDSNKLPLTIMNALTKFSGQCQFNVMISRLFAHQIKPEERTKLKEVWDKFDVDNDGSLNLKQFKNVMNEYDHGYKEYQIEAMFDSLDWNETESINFQSLLDAYSYQRLVAVDERLWEAFAKLDVDNDGHITKAEIKRVLATVNPEGFDEGVKQLELWQPINDDYKECDDYKDYKKLSNEERRNNISIWIGNCMIDADWDDDGQIDYEEFLRALHPRFNEAPVTPTQPNQPQDEQTPYFFQPSIGDVAALDYIPSGKPVDDQPLQVSKDNFDTYIKKLKQ